MFYWVVGLSHISWVFYTSSSVHTGGPSSKAFTRIEVIQKAEYLGIVLLFQLMMRHVCMASLYALGSAQTGGPSSQAFARIYVMQKPFLQLCCFHSVHKVSAHDGSCLYGRIVDVGLRPHPGTHLKSIY